MLITGNVTTGWLKASRTIDTKLEKQDKGAGSPTSFFTLKGHHNNGTGSGTGGAHSNKTYPNTHEKTQTQSWARLMSKSLA